MIGRTISHYKILEKLGEGGMGVVYKAHDTKLDRDVALKFLPQSISPTEEEKNRFIHEAKAASALDHPNICTIYEVNETPEGQLFISMGYYEGISLSKKIQKGHLDIEEAIAIATQIAEGLQAAHEQGIFHRDIKSSNIMLTKKGQVRILDFGLAHKGGLSKLTRTGSTVGTAAYMSPGQARGEKLDHRTDLWSLGVVLYEMVTGKLPFRGDHEAAILYSVVNEEPQPLQTSVPDASPELIHIIRRALEKDPRDRYQSAADMLIDLRRLKKDTSRDGFAPVSGSRRRVSSLKNKLLIATGSIILLCIAGYFYFVRNGVEINVNYSQRRIEVPYQNGIDPAISPDGKWIVFTAPDKNGKVDLYAMSSSGGTPRRLTNDSTQPIPLYGWGGYSYPRVSPDGSSVVYARYFKDQPPELCIVPLVGGQAAKIAEGASASWSPEGKRIGYVKSPGFSESKKGEFWTIRADGKENRREFIDTVGLIAESGTNILEVFLFDWSPDGGSIAWLRRLPQLHCEIVVRDLATGTESRITTDTTIKDGLCWLRNNTIVYSSSGEDGVHLRAIPRDGGTSVQITRGSGAETAPTASLDGSTILFWSTSRTADIGIGKLDGSEPIKVATINGGIAYGWTNPSPANKQIVFSRAIPGLLSFTLSLINYDGTDERALTKGVDRADLFPVWSPNGNWIAFISRKTFEPYDSYKVYVVNPKTIEEPRLIFPGGGFQFPEWLNDTTLLVSKENNTKWFWAYLNGRPRIQIAADSILPNFVADRKYVLYKDLHKKVPPNTWWIVPIARWRKDGGIDPEIFEGGVRTGWISGGFFGRCRFELWCDTSKGDLWKVWFPDRSKEQILRSSNLLKGIRNLQMSWDETEYSFSRLYFIRGEINVIENLFK